GHRSCRATIQRKNHSMAVCWLRSQQRVFLYTQFFLVPAVASRSPRSLPLIREHVVVGTMSARDDNADARSWRKAYGLSLSLFAVEVVLLYLFTLRFS